MASPRSAFLPSVSVLGLLILAACPSQDPLQGVGSATLEGPWAFTVHSAVAARADGGAASSAFWLVDANTNCEDLVRRGSVPFITRALAGAVVSLSDDALQPGEVPIGDTGE